jgi:predicted AAA+ superfamily ATPase
MSGLVAFKELLVFLSSITPGEVNVHKIAKNIGKKDDTVKSYLQILHDTSVLRFLPNSMAGHAKLKAAETIYFDNPNLLQAFSYFTGNGAEKGLIRETFVVEQLQSSGLIPLYSKNGGYHRKRFPL